MKDFQDFDGSTKHENPKYLLYERLCLYIEMPCWICFGIFDGEFVWNVTNIRWQDNEEISDDWWAYYHQRIVFRIKTLYSHGEIITHLYLNFNGAEDAIRITNHMPFRHVNVITQ